MSRIHRANERAASARRRFGRVRRRKSKMARAFEVIAALIPAMVLLIHLMLRSAHPLAEDQARRRPVRLAHEITQTLNPEMAVVPEPSSLALFGLGAALLFYFRRSQTEFVPPTQIPAR